MLLRAPSSCRDLLLLFTRSGSSGENAAIGVCGRVEDVSRLGARADLDALLEPIVHAYVVVPASNGGNIFGALIATPVANN